MDNIQSGEISQVRLPRKEQLRSQLSFPLASIIFLAVLISSGIASWAGFHREFNQQVNLLQGTAKVFSASLAEPLFEKDRRRVQLALTAIGKFENLKFASVLLADETPFAEMGFESMLQKNLQRSDYQSGLSIYTKNVWLEDTVVYSGQGIGYLRILADVSDIWNNFFWNLLANILAAAASAFVAARFSWIIISRLTKPITNLSNLMARLGGTGDYAVRASEDVKGEAGLLAKSFNNMLADIENRDFALREYQLTLETRVEERTRQLSIAKNDAEQANAAKSDFLATMSHEIRTPMNGMLLMSELLAGANLAPKHQRYADVIVKSGKNLLTIINDILDLSKIQADRLELERIDVEIKELVEDAMSLFWQKAREKNLDITARVSRMAGTKFKGDPTRINQILSNLINNAIKFTDSGSVTLDVEPVKSETGERYLRFSVKDTGIGINPDGISKVFENFSQADQTTTRKYGGTGLGLPICKKLVEAMGGEISVESESGAGSTFSFQLPVDDVPSVEKSRFSDGRSALLLAEDTPTTRLIADVLAEYGIETCIMSTGGPVLPELNSFDYVFASVTELLRMQHYPEGAYVTALAELGDANLDDLLASGLVHEVLSQPFSSISVRECLERLIDKKPKGQTLLEISGPETETYKSYSGNRVLVVDDGAVNREVVMQALGNFEVSPVLAESGLQAIAEFEANEFDLVFMDCSMPDVDGFEATRALRNIEEAQARQPIPIIALTAHVAEQIAGKVEASTMNDIVVKPFTLETIGACLDKWLNTDSGTRKNKNSISELTEESEKIDDSEPKDIEVLDYALLENLREIAGDGFDVMISQLFKLYRDNAPTTYLTLKNAVETRDADQVQSAAHALKSMSMNIGARKVGEACQRLEDSAKLQNCHEIPGQFKELTDCYKSLYAFLEERFFSGSATDDSVAC
ncbi:MAG: ATP-binding protein [Pseudomonadota bacterium]